MVRLTYIKPMKRFLIPTLCALALTTPAQADPKDWEDLRKGLELLSKDTQKFFESWVDDIGPLLNSLRDKVDDLGHYAPPEVLPNGDIILRRKPEKPAPTAQKPSIEI
ncbi:MAG: hypothetical protein COB84_10330 [Rhodobacteraceae bacterium]|nr:MAG: hypothetical protein COB84_10330 [Paracoccaceae bacterium]